MYADFEAITEQIQDCQPNNQHSYSGKYQKHTGCGFGYKLVCCYNDKCSKPVQGYRGEGPIEKFMHEILKEEDYCRNIIQSKFNKPLRMNHIEEKSFKTTKECHICGIPYTDNDIRVRDNLMASIEVLHTRTVILNYGLIIIHVNYQSFFIIYEGTIAILLCKKLVK